MERQNKADKGRAKWLVLGLMSAAIGVWLVVLALQGTGGEGKAEAALPHKPTSSAPLPRMVQVRVVKTACRLQAPAGQAVEVPKGAQVLAVGEAEGKVRIVWKGAEGLVPSENLAQGGLCLEAGRKRGDEGAAERREIAREALTWLGVPYVWGGTSKRGCDCSGFVQTLFAAKGIKLPRTTGPQAHTGFAVPLTELEPGDRLCFSFKGDHVDHTGVYVGEGEFVHASGKDKRVVLSSLKEARYARHVVGARRDEITSD